MHARLLCLWACLLLGATARAEPGPSAGITIEDGSLSVDLREVPLASVVTDIATRTGIVLHMENGRALPRVTARFSHLPFAEGLTRLLKHAPGSLVVRNEQRGYAGVAALYVIASRGEAGPLPQAPPATMEDIRHSIEALPRRAESPDVRQAYDAARAPPPGTVGPAVPSRSVQRAQNLDRLLRDIGAATGGMGPSTAPSMGNSPTRHDEQRDPQP